MNPQTGNDTSWSVCVVGLGGHARTKIIPALLANGQNIVGVVSSQSMSPAGVETESFRRLDEAMSALSRQTLFVLASPPAVHYEQTMKLIAAGRDVCVEKPAFISEKQAIDAFAAAQSKRAVLFEAFMHRHTECYRRAIAFWREESSKVVAIDISFFIPAMPTGTFRNDAEVASSSLYDMGCYGLSLIDDLGLPLDEIVLSRLALRDSDRQESLTLSGVTRGVAVTLRLGVDASYENTLSFQTSDERRVIYAPIFYGRAGQRTTTVIDRIGRSESRFDDRNAFQEMFLVPRTTWLTSQPERQRGVVAVTAALERLGTALSLARKMTSKL